MFVCFIVIITNVLGKKKKNKGQKQTHTVDISP